MAKGKLTAKQEMFVREYLVDLNATQAAIRAGYSKKTAQRMGSENLSKPLVSKEVERLKASRAEKAGINAEYVLEKAQEIFAWAMEDGDRKDAMKALELIGKHVGVGAFKDRVEVEGNLNVAIGKEAAGVI